MNETNHPARRLRHGQRPTEPLVFDDAAANKAAEEGGLDELLSRLAFARENEPPGGAKEAKDAIRAYIAADRASRQVANKAYVEPVEQSQSALEEALMNILVEQTSLTTDGIDDCVPRLVAAIPSEALPYVVVPTEGINPALYATPPATTGASIDTPEFRKLTMAYAQAIMHGTVPESSTAWGALVDHVDGRGSVGASTVLTDERIKAIFLAHGFTIKEGLSDLKPYVYAAAHAVAREVAAQAGQVAVPADVIAKLDKVSRWIDKFPIPTTGATAMICHLRDVKEALAPSPAKESK